MDEPYTLDELEMIYLTEYDEDEVDEDTGEEVIDFINWLRKRNS